MLPRLHKSIASKTLFLTCVIFLNACAQSPINNSDATTNSTESVTVEFDRYQLLLASLLDDVDVNHFSYTDQQGVKKFDQLKHFKALEQVYISSIERKTSHTRLTTDQLKILLFFSFYAEQKNSAAFLEYLAADLMPAYKMQTQEFLKLLNNYSFLVRPNCRRLNAYFGFEGKNLTEKPSFISSNRDLILENLSIKNAKKCLYEFE